jgi:phosphatidylserine/phosphatidylglycerophosphate/cardiolipin synthase-like enzyme
VSGLQQEGKDYATLHTPDCSNLKNPIGTKSIVAWLQQHRGEASAVYVAIFTFTDPDIKNELIAMQKSGVQVYVMLDYNQLQSVGNVADKKAAEALKNPGATNNTGTKKRRSKTPKQSEHMIANDLCTAGAQVVWGYSPDGHSIMHLKRIIIFDKQGKPHWEEDGSFNFTVAANWEANDLGFDDDPADAAKDFAQWTYLHDQMLAQNKPFYSTDLGLPQACPTLDKVPYAAKH